MLVEHGIDHVNKSFIGGKEAMPACQKVTFEHSFHGLFAEHLDNSPVSRQFTAVRVLWKVFGDPEFLADLINRVEFVRCILVGAEYAEAVQISFHHVAKEGAQRASILCFNLSGLVNLQLIG